MLKITSNKNKGKSKTVNQRGSVSDLKVNAEIYYSIFNNTSDGVCIQNLDAIILDTNDAYCRMSGYSRSEIIGSPVSKFEAKENPREIALRIKKLLKMDGHDRFETIHRRKDGTTFFADVTLLFLDREGGIIASITRDISDRKKLEELLKNKSKELEIMLDSSPAMIFYKDTKNNCIFVNKTFENKMGIPKSKIEGKSLFEVFPKEYAQAYWQDDLEVIKSGKAKYGIIEKTQTARGTRIVQTDKIPFVDEDGKIIGIIGFIIDITDRKLAEEEVVESEKKFRLAFENSQDAILWADIKTGILVDCNTAAEKLFEKSKNELVGQHFTTLHPPEDLNKVKEVFKKHTSSALNSGDEVPIITKSGKIKHVLISACVVELKRTRIVQGVFHDITDRKKLEEALMQSIKRKDEFINIASHELKTPLTSIKAFNQILTRKLELQEYADTVSFTRKMDEQINNLSSLISDFLDVSKITSGHLLLRQEYFDLMTMINDTIADFSIIAPGFANKIVVKGNIQNNIYGDRFRVSQVLLNLLTNADKYAAESAKIIICVTSLKNSIKISVQDFGGGISKENQQHLFERFFQVDSSGNSANGKQSLGMGLYISAEIIHRHKGKIWVKSTPGKGSTFYFSLPRNTSGS